MQHAKPWAVSLHFSNYSTSHALLLPTQENPGYAAINMKTGIYGDTELYLQTKTQQRQWLKM
jgi:hypothetical protein